MWAIEASPSPKVAYRGGWHHFTTGYTTELDPI